MLEYDRVVTRDYRGVPIEYGVMSAVGAETTNIVLLIMVGQDGSIYGFNNKYLKMAEYWRRKCFHAVVVASNPSAAKGDTVQLAEAVVKEEIGIAAQDLQIFFFGHSDGARRGACFAYNSPYINRMVLVNMPIRKEHFTRTVGALESFYDKTGWMPVIVYGVDDPAYPIARLILEQFLVWLEIVEADADHHYTNKLDEFILLPELMLDQEREK